jgi:hypothetical protein
MDLNFLFIEVNYYIKDRVVVNLIDDLGLHRVIDFISGDLEDITQEEFPIVSKWRFLK